MRRSLLLCFFAVGAGALPGEEAAPADAPLSGTKQQLQALKRDEAAQKNGTPAGVQLDLPSVNAPGLSTDFGLTRPKKEDDADAKKNTRRRNWLLDGYDKLDRKKTGAEAHDKKDADAMEEERELDPKDPDFFLRVYERQRAQSEAKQLEMRQANPEAGDNRLATGSDPFAPFMKEWLAHSPVRDALRETGAADTAPRSATPAVPGAQAVDTPPTGVGFGLGENSHGPAAPNPFLQALGLPAADAKPTDFHSPVAEGALKNPLENRLPPPNAQPASMEPSRSDNRNAVPPPPDDKKYFPQLKKF